jgi:hypothetical protein
MGGEETEFVVLAVASGLQDRVEEEEEEEEEQDEVVEVKLANPSEELEELEIGLKALRSS